MSTTAMWLLLAVVVILILFFSVLYKRRFTVHELALTGVMAALSLVAYLFFRIPFYGGSSFHLGNTFTALTALLLLISRLPFAPCAQIEALHSLVKLFPYHDTSGEALGVAMEDELSGALTLAFDLLEVSEDSLDATFDSRCPICANEENVLEPARRRLAEHGFTLTNETMTPPHYVDGNSDFVKTLLKAYERYTGRKGTCESMGGGTYVHSLKNGVAFGAAMPETDNRMHGADEFAVIDELLVSAKIFAQVITDLCR